MMNAASNGNLSRRLAGAGCAALVLCAVNAKAATESRGVSLSDVQVQQRYPWNGLVDIDYTISCDSGAKLGVDDNLEVWMVDKSIVPAITNRAYTFKQVPLPMTAGRHRVTWDAHADGVKTRTDVAEFHVEIVHYSEAYMVIDVSGGPDATVYPTRFVNRPPAGENGFNTNEYKTDKIVLRRIHPGSYMAGSPEDEFGFNKSGASDYQHPVVLTKPFYIGVFEITQKQYLNVMGGTNPDAAEDHQGDERPIGNVTLEQIRGKGWPSVTVPAAATFLGKLLAKCKSANDRGDFTESVAGLDIPTSFQWEYACRAGTLGAFNTTNEYDNTSESGQASQMMQLGRYFGNRDTDGKGGYTGYHTAVGSYLPNAWGLYDMHGNVWERCRDLKLTDVRTCEIKDPKGALSGSVQILKGGGCSEALQFCRSGRYNGDSGTYNSYGFRIIREIP